MSSGVRRLKRREVELLFLGTASNPSPFRNSSSVLFKLGKLLHLFDCAEGSFRQLQNTPYSSRKFNNIFITHMHGDHVWGLPAFLCSAKFKETAEIYGPPGLRDWLRTSMKICRGKVSSKYKVHELVFSQERSLEQVASLNIPSNPHEDELPGLDISCSGDGVWHLVQDDKQEIKAGLLTHNVPCWGYVWTEVIQRRKADESGDRGDSNQALELRTGRKVVILGDTSDSSSLQSAAKDADVLVHEAAIPRECNKAVHSTPEMAGQFAKSIAAKKLILTHLNRHVGTRRIPADNFLKPAKLAFGSDDVLLAEDFYSLKLV